MKLTIHLARMTICGTWQRCEGEGKGKGIRQLMSSATAFDEGSQAHVMVCTTTYVR